MDPSEEEMPMKNHCLAGFSFSSDGMKIKHQQQKAKPKKWLRYSTAGWLQQVLFGGIQHLRWTSVASPQGESLGLFYTLLFIIHCIEHFKAHFDRLACWDENPSKWHRSKGTQCYSNSMTQGTNVSFFFLKVMMH